MDNLPILPFLTALRNDAAVFDALQRCPCDQALLAVDKGYDRIKF
ncbi:MAG: hypothetical protein RIR04_1247, partial [Pseudomonadota bacterium]